MKYGVTQLGRYLFVVGNISDGWMSMKNVAATEVLFLHGDEIFDTDLILFSIFI